MKAVVAAFNKEVLRGDHFRDCENFSDFCFQLYTRHSGSASAFVKTLRRFPRPGPRVARVAVSLPRIYVDMAMTGHYSRVSVPLSRIRLALVSTELALLSTELALVSKELSQSYHRVSTG